MKKIIIFIIALLPLTSFADESVKEKKIAKYVMENIQKDYVNCYSFYKVAAESFKKAGKEKQVIDSFFILLPFFLQKYPQMQQLQ